MYNLICGRKIENFMNLIYFSKWQKNCKKTNLLKKTSFFYNRIFSPSRIDRITLKLEEKQKNKIGKKLTNAKYVKFLFLPLKGVQFIRDCPREPNIPIYMVVGGILGSVRMFWTLYTQIRSRRPEVLTVPGVRSRISE